MKEATSFFHLYNLIHYLNNILVCFGSQTPKLSNWKVYWTCYTLQLDLLMVEIGVSFGCPSGLAWPNPTKWEMRGWIVFGIKLHRNYHYIIIKKKKKKSLLLSLSQKSLKEHASTRKSFFLNFFYVKTKIKVFVSWK